MMIEHPISATRANYARAVAAALALIVLRAPAGAIAQETAKNNLQSTSAVKKPQRDSAGEAATHTPFSETKPRVADEQKSTLSETRPVFAAKPKSALGDFTRVSTAEAARNAAIEATKKQTSSKQATKAQGSSRAPDGNVESDVLEFRPAVQDAEQDTRSHPSISTKPARKNIHGSVSGSIDPTHSGNHESSAAVGVGSKSGKTHLYLETEQSRSAVPTLNSPSR